MRNNLNEAREIYFKYFFVTENSQNKSHSMKVAMLGIPLAHFVANLKHAEKKGKGKTPRIGVK